MPFVKPINGSFRFLFPTVRFQGVIFMGSRVSIGIRTIRTAIDIASDMSTSKRFCLSCSLTLLYVGLMGIKTDANGAKIKCTRGVGHAFKYIVPLLYFHIFETGSFD